MSMARKESAHFVERRLDGVWQRLRWLRAKQAVLGISIVILSLIVIALASDWLLHWSAGWRTVVWAVGVVGIAGLVFTKLALPWMRKPNSSVLAAVVEECAPEWNEQLLTAAQLTTAFEEGAEGDFVNAAIHNRLIAETEQQLQELDLGRQVEFDNKRRWLLWGIGLVIVLVSPLVFYPQTYQLLWQRMIVPWSTDEKPTNLWFEIVEPPTVVALGEDAMITATPRWRDQTSPIKEIVYLNWETGNGQSHRRLMEFNREQNSYDGKIPRLSGDVTYFVSAGASRSQSNPLHVEPRPEIETLDVSVTPPAYTRLEKRELDSSKTRWQVFEQSHLAFQLTFNKPVARALLEFLPVNEKSQANSFIQEVTLNSQGLQGNATWTAREDVEIKVTAIDRWGLKSRDDRRWQLAVNRDQRPTVAIELEPDVFETTIDTPLAVHVSAADDCGIGQARLLWTTTEGGPAGSWDLSLPTDNDGRQQMKLSHAVDLSQLNVTVGSVVTFQAEVVDSRPNPGPQKTLSEKKTVRIVGRRQAMAAEFQRRIDRWKSELTALHDRMANMRQMNEELSQQAQAAETEKEQQAINRRLNRLAVDEQRLAESLQALAQKMSDYPLYERLAKQIGTENTQGLSKASQLTEKSLATNDTNQKLGLLDESDQELANVDRQLKASRDGLERLAKLESDLQQIDDLAYAANRLAQQVENLKQLLPPKSGNESESQRNIREQLLAEEAARLAGRETQLSKRLEKLLNDHRVLHDAFQQHQLKQMREMGPDLDQLAQLQQMLSEAAKSLEPEPMPAEDTSKDKQGQNPKKEAGSDDASSQKPKGDKQSNTAEGGKENSKDSKDGESAAKELAEQIKQTKQSKKNSRSTVAGQQSQLRKLTEQATQKMRSLVSPKMSAANGDSEQANRQKVIDARIQQTARNTQAGSQAMQKAESGFNQGETSRVNQQSTDAASKLQTSATMVRKLGNGLSVPEAEVPESLGAQMMSAGQALIEARQSLQPFLVDGLNNGLAGPPGKEKNRSGSNGKESSQANDGQSGQEGDDAKSQQADANGKKSPTNDDVQKISESLRQSAQAMKEAQKQLQKRSSSSDVANQQRANENAPNSVSISELSRPASEDGDYAGMTLEEIELLRVQLKAWGELPEPLRIEILQGREQPFEGEYKRLIQRYFEALAPRPTAVSPSKPNRSGQ